MKLMLGLGFVQWIVVIYSTYSKILLLLNCVAILKLNY